VAGSWLARWLDGLKHEWNENILEQGKNKNISRQTYFLRHRKHFGWKEN
jgi:hypothetical protein